MEAKNKIEGNRLLYHFGICWNLCCMQKLGQKSLAYIFDRKTKYCLNEENK